ncbi:MAG: LPS translocon maturation chaperone LptM [Steroidobacteraceae bacterium]
MRVLCLWVLVGLTLTIYGCGQKGPLVLPDAQHPPKKVKFPAPPKLPTTTAPADHPAEPAPEPESGSDAAPASSPAQPQSTP